jgi:hypothetical protein
MIETGARKPVVTCAYAARARTYQEIQDFDHAIADYSEAIQRSADDR